MVHYWFFQRFYDDIDLVLDVYLRDKLYLRWETRIASECKICFLYDSKIDVLKCINTSGASFYIQYFSTIFRMRTFTLQLNIT